MPKNLKTKFPAIYVRNLLLSVFSQAGHFVACKPAELLGPLLAMLGNGRMSDLNIKSSSLQYKRQKRGKRLLRNTIDETLTKAARMMLCATGLAALVLLVVSRVFRTFDLG